MAELESEQIDDNAKEEAELAELGVPSIDQPFIQKYLDGRDALIAQEKKQRSDHVFREYMSPLASEASAIISAIRFEEQQTLWNPTAEDNLAKTSDVDIYPGMMFSLAKDKMQSSKLFKIVKKMPKGALLHCHLEAMGDPEWLIEEGFRTKGIHIAADSSLDTVAARETADFRFQHSSEDNNENESIWTPSYKPGSLMSLETAANTFPHGGKQGFIAWFISRVTITHEESLLHHRGPYAIWRKFLSCFSILASLQHYEPIFRKYMQLFLTNLFEDGVSWVDIRAVFIVPFTPLGADKPDADFFSLMEAMLEEIDKFKAAHTGFWGGRLIWTAARNLSMSQIAATMKDCIDMKIEFPELIAGFDMVGHEDAGKSLAELTPLLFWFKKQCAEAGVDIPFYLHAGETLEDGTLTDENLFDAVLLGTRRIGHAFSLYKHPLLIDMVKDKKILVESCPISNEILRLTSSIMSHTLPALLARGVHCSLSNDDPAILGQGESGLSHDFWQALQGWENLGLPGLASLAENSVRWATFDDCTTKEWNEQIKEGSAGKSVRAQRMQQWAKDFEKFCQWVIVEYGAETDRDFLD